MSRVTRKEEIRRRQRRQMKIRKLRQKLAKTKNPGDIDKIKQKITRINPLYPIAQLA